MAGNFLSRPKRDGPGECDTNEKMGMSYGVIGVQGWRMSMEDAHICICDLKQHCESTLNCSPELLATIPHQSSLFAVFDGHGGEEVATLCARKFPKFLVEDENFEKNDFEAALKSTYMRMDEYVKSSEGQYELQEILDQSAKNKKNNDEDDEEEEDLDEEMENGGGDQDSEEEIRTGDCDDDNEEGEVGDEDEEDDEGDAISEGTGQLLNSLISGGFLNFLADRTKQMKEELKTLADEDDDDEEDDFNPDDVTSSEGEEDDEDENENDEEEGEDEAKDENSESKEKEDSESEREDKLDASESNGTENGVSEKVKGSENEVDGAGDATKNSDTGDASEVDSTEKSTSKADKRKKIDPEKLVVQLKEDNGKTDENEESENGKDDSETDEDSELMNGDGVIEEDVLMEKPGFDSGCTAVVALKVASKLYVANAGDSRCVLSLKSVATPLSRDHNPTVPEEITRVEAAGGKIEAGRVDGGLNLTRAFGDHRYKQNSELPLEKQRISAEAEVTVTDLDPQTSACENGTGDPIENTTSDFFVLACDGIWECLENEIVISEIAERLFNHNLFEICHQMTEKCIAPSCKRNQTTGLDNMTIIIVTLQPHKLTTRVVHEPRFKKLKNDQQHSETMKREESAAKTAECYIAAKIKGNMNANGVDSDDTLTNGKEGDSENGTLGNGIEKSDLKRSNESAFENGIEDGSQSCKVLKTE